MRHRFLPARLSSRARGICFFLSVGVLATSTVQAQAKRPRILGIGRVTIQGEGAPTDNPARFYSELGFSTIASYQTGAPERLIYAVNDHQEIDLQVGPRLEPAPNEPPRNNLSLVLFETSDVVAFHDYLQLRQVDVSSVTPDSVEVKDAEGKSILGDPLMFTLKDPDGHWIGFMQYKSALKFRNEQGKTISHLIHAGFIVRDRAATEHFYKDILGFRPYWHGGMKDDGKDDWVSLQVPDGTDWIEMMVNVDSNPDQRLRGVMNHMAIGVPDIHETEKRLKAAGVHLTEEPEIGRDGKWQLNVYDPDFTRVEFMEFKPVQKPCCSEYTGPHPGSQQ